MAYEIHPPNNQLYAAYLALLKAGEAHGMQFFGARAIDSMRLEKGFLHWKADLLTEFAPYETGLDRFVRMAKPDFIGKAALEARLAAGPRRKLVTLQVHAQDRPATPGASVMIDGQVTLPAGSTHSSPGTSSRQADPACGRRNAYEEMGPAVAHTQLYDLRNAYDRSIRPRVTVE